jgi:hypothetical protein
VLLAQVAGEGLAGTGVGPAAGGAAGGLGLATGGAGGNSDGSAEMSLGPTGGGLGALSVGCLTEAPSELRKGWLGAREMAQGGAACTVLVGRTPDAARERGR